jgi:2-phosphosulfolactate phosphatase
MADENILIKIVLTSLNNYSEMNIEILQFVEGAKKAKGFVVIIDVFRAFSVGCYAFDSGAARVIATGSIENARLLASKYRNCVLAGERDEKIIEGFDFGNSPTEIIKNDLTGKTFIHTTTAGTQGLVNASSSDYLITGSLVNAGAIINYIKKINPSHVSLVAMGYRASIPAEEDLLCAEIIADGIKGNLRNYDEVISELKHTSGKRFFEPKNLDFSPPTDFFLCTMLNRFNFILKAIARPDGNIDLMRLDI